ncbi:MAG: hypothetical protein J3K34DRAFT_400216 [Monoraphidium minutum]|nr:MAG: hypothetical protein J3K34DRAFT_400216 [Monoraphidium minutum]
MQHCKGHAALPLIRWWRVAVVCELLLLLCKAEGSAAHPCQCQQLGRISSGMLANRFGLRGPPPTLQHSQRCLPAPRPPAGPLGPRLDRARRRGPHAHPPCTLHTPLHASGAAATPTPHPPLLEGCHCTAPPAGSGAPCLSRAATLAPHSAALRPSAGRAWRDVGK